MSGAVADFELGLAEFVEVRLSGRIIARSESLNRKGGEYLVEYDRGNGDRARIWVAAEFVGRSK